MADKIMQVITSLVTLKIYKNDAYLELPKASVSLYCWPQTDCDSSNIHAVLYIQGNFVFRDRYPGGCRLSGVGKVSS